MSDICKLCQASNDLRASHILPRFVGKYLKETSATGFLTAIDGNDRPSRSQDLYKRKLLCDKCESIMNEAETFFANTLFYPFKQNKLKNISIDDRFGKFAVSVSLRVLWVMQLVEHPLTERWEDKLGELEDEWRNYLLRTPNFIMGENSHHILLCNEDLLAVGLKNHPNLVYNIMRSSAYYIFEKFEKAYIFANLAGVQIISMVSPPDLPVSRGMQVYPKQTFGVDPAGIGWGGYFQNLIELTSRCNKAFSSLSEGQKEKIESAINKNPERATKSEDARIIRMQEELLRNIHEEID